MMTDRVLKASRKRWRKEYLYTPLMMIIVLLTMFGCNDDGGSDNDPPSHPVETVSWSKDISINDADEAQSVIQTEEGGYLIAGSSLVGNGNRDVLLVKLDKLGIVEWERTYGGIGSDTATCVLELPGTGYLIAGTTGLPDDRSEIYLLCVGPDGNVLWEKTYGGADDVIANSIALTSDNGCIIAGSSVINYTAVDDELGNSPVEDWNAYFLKIDNDGDLIWEQTITDERYTGEDEYGISARETSDGGYVLVGNSLNASTFGDMLLARTDANGTILWTNHFGESSSEELVYDVIETKDNGFILTGQFNSDFGAPGSGCLVLKTDADGTRMWSEVYNAASTSGAGVSIVESTDDSFVVTGYGYSYGTGSNDIYLVKFDTDGKMIWERFLGDGADERGSSVQATADGGYIIAGNVTDGKSSHILLLKTDENGEIGAE